MDLVLLPHHNTVTSLQKLEHPQIAAEKEQQSCVFLPQYPLICVLAHTEETSEPATMPAVREKTLSSQMRTLKDMLRDERGSLRFGTPLLVSREDGSSSARPDTLIVPAMVPFMDKLEAAGFQPVKEPHIVLGRWYARCAENLEISDKAFDPDRMELPATSRSFRLALMQCTPLSDGTPGAEAGPAAAFSWKYHDAFWVKLH